MNFIVSNTRKNNRVSYGPMQVRKNNTRKNNMRINTATTMMGGKMTTIGSRAQVFHGTAHHTSGGLTRKDLKKNKHGRIVSVKASAAGRKALKFLHRKGFVAKKGTFKLFH